MWGRLGVLAGCLLCWLIFRPVLVEARPLKSLVQNQVRTRQSKDVLRIEVQRHLDNAHCAEIPCAEHQNLLTGPDAPGRESTFTRSGRIAP